MTLRSSMSVLFTVAVVVACGGGGTDPAGGGDGNGGAPPEEGPPLSGTVTIAIENIAFVDPDGRTNDDFHVRVEQGTTLRWRNDDGVGHTVTSGEGQNGNDGDGLPAGAGMGIQSGNIQPGETFEFTFDTPGTWTYFCEIHPFDMFGATVEVVAP